MDADIERIKREMKLKRSNFPRKLDKKPSKKQPVPHKFYFKYVMELIVTVILTLATLIALKSSTQFKTAFYKKVYDTNFTFATLNQLYQNTFGSPIPFLDLFNKKGSTPVFEEKLAYKELNKYKDGVKLSVDTNYLIPTLESGMVVFIGEKEGYGKTVIVQQVNGVDVWYSNVDNVKVKLYDYLEKGSLLGETKNDYFYMVFKKEGKVLDYKTYLS